MNDLTSFDRLTSFITLVRSEIQASLSLDFAASISKERSGREP